MPSISAAQLFYTNVEANLSPTNVRGEQLWCYTPDLPEDVVAAAEARAKAYPPSKLAAPEIRDCFAKLPNSEYFLLARTTPQTKPDKFGRLGRFHAHVLLIKEAEFALVNSNPFRIFAQFTFHDSPEKTNKERKGLTIPAVVIELKEEPETSPESHKMHDIMLTALEGKVSFVHKAPAKEQLVILKNFFQVVPPELRAKASFDTFTSGVESAQQYFWSGATANDILKPCAEKCDVLDEKGNCKPPLPPLKRPWLLELFHQFQASTLPEPARNAIYAVAVKLFDEGELRELPAEFAADDCKYLERLAGFSEVKKRLIEQRLKASVPNAALLKIFPSLRTEGDKYYQFVGMEGLQRLLKEVPDELMLKGLLSDLETEPKQLKDDLLQVLVQWVGNDQNLERRKLRYILRRWTTGKEFEKALALLQKPPTDKDEIRSWFFKWCQTTLRPEYTGDGVAERLLTKLMQAEELSPKDLRECELALRYLAVPVKAIPAQAIPVAKLLRTTEKLDEQEVHLLDDTGKPEVDEQPEIIEEVEEEPDDTNALLPKIFLEARKYNTSHELQAYLQKHRQALRYLLKEWLARLPLKKHLSYLIGGNSTYREHYWGVEVRLREPSQFHFLLLSALLQEKKEICFEKFLSFTQNTEHNPDRGATKETHIEAGLRFAIEQTNQVGTETELAALFKGLSDDEFRTLAEELVLDKIDAKKHVLELNDVVFIGLKLHTHEHKTREKILKMARALVSPIIAGIGVDDVGEPAELHRDYQYRFEWLIKRLARPMETVTAPLLRK